MKKNLFNVGPMEPGACFEFPFALRYDLCVTAWVSDAIKATLLTRLLNGWRQRKEHACVLMAHLAGGPPRAFEARLSYEANVVPLIPGYASPLKYEDRVLAWFRSPALAGTIAHRVNTTLQSLAEANARPVQPVLSRQWFDAMVQAEVEGEMSYSISA